MIVSGQGASTGLHGNIQMVVGGGAGTIVEEINSSGTNVASYEVGFVGGANVTIGSTSGVQATGTNVLSFVTGTAPTAA